MVDQSDLFTGDLVDGAVDGADEFVAVGGLKVVVEFELLTRLMSLNGEEDGLFVGSQFGGRDFHGVRLTMILGLLFDGAFLSRFVGIIDRELA